MPSIAAAQTTQPPVPDTEEDGQPVADDDTDENVIVVSGFRAALESAVNEKRNSDLILESVTAEDIGKLPDDSIGESIARLPGIASQRLNGRANVIAIRGLGPDFSQTLLNGREQTSTGDSRAVEFDQYPSEVVSQVNVYKTPSASLVGQGLVGTVDVRTIRPLEVDEPIFAIGAKGSYADIGALNAGSRDYGYRLNATFVDQFADDTIGVALAAAYTDEPYQLQEFNAWGYAGDGTPGNPYIIGGNKSFVTSTRLKRFGVNGTLQYQASPNFMVTVDGFYSSFDDDQSKRGIELPLGFSNPYTTSSVVDGPFGGFAESGTFTDVRGVVRNDVFQRQADLYSGGLNLDYDGDDGWSAFFDFGYSRTDRSELSLETNAGTGYGPGVGATDTLDFVSTKTGTRFTSSQLDYSDPNLMVLTDPLGWGAGAPLGHQEGYYNDRIIDDELKSYQIEFGKEVDSGFLSKVTAGLGYTDRTKSKTPNEYFLNLANGATSLVLPDQYRMSATDLDIIGVGPILSYDPFKLLEDGVYVLTTNPSKDVPAKAYSVTERVMSAYLMADIKADLGSAELTGNVGVLAQNTEQKSRGFQNLAAADLVPTTRGATYWDVLPSANLSLRFPSDFVIRLSGAREIQRPRFEDMKVSLDYGYNTNSGVITGTGGSPTLRPYRAWAADMNFEKYFGTKGYVGLQLFYKKLQSYVYRETVPFDYTGLPVILPPGVTDLQGTITRPVNGSGGKLYGFEVAGTVPFEVITPALEGFGLTGGAGYTKTSIRPGVGASAEDLPDYSRWVANGTLFFEKWGFSARGSVRYRSSFVGQFVGFGGERELRRALSETIVDAQIGYEFQKGSALEGLSFFLQGQNLTDEPFVSVDTGASIQTRNYQSYGARYMAGFNYRF